MGYKTTRRYMRPLKVEEEKFLRALARWQGVASTQDLAPQMSQADNAARQSCKRNGWVTFDKSYWRMTDNGRAKLRSTDDLRALSRQIVADH